MKKLAVIGKDVSKSASPQIHNFIAKKLGLEIEYDNISVPEEEFSDKISGILESYDGLNVTIPYKLSVIPYLKTTVGDAVAFGAVNTVNTRTLTGYNTDGEGFALMLSNAGVDLKGKTALVIGAGGAGRSVAAKLLEGGARTFIYDKNADSARAVKREFRGVTALENIPLTPYYAVINASGVGMHRTEGLSPVGGELLSLCEVAADLIYVPAKSRFLEIAASYGKKIINGLAMLFYQAYFAECIFFERTPDENEAKKLFEEYAAAAVQDGNL